MVLSMKLIILVIKVINQKQEKLKLQYMQKQTEHSHIKKMDAGGCVLMMREIFIKLMQAVDLKNMIINI